MEDKLTLEERIFVLTDYRTNEELSKMLGVSSGYISAIRVNSTGTGNYVRSCMNEYDHKLESWSREKRNYIKRKCKFDKSKTKEEHAAIFDLENPAPLRNTHNAT